MARPHDGRQEALELVFACSACGNLLSELQAAARPSTLANVSTRTAPASLTQLWLSDCGHILCRNELPPSWPLNAIDDGKPLELICPICEAENHGRQCARSKLYYIRSFEKDGYHPDIPPDLFTLPEGPVGDLFNGDDGSLKFQFASLLKYTMNTTRELQAMHRFLEKQRERLSILDEQLTTLKSEARHVPAIEPARTETDEAREVQVTKLLRCLEGTRQIVECLRATRGLLSDTTSFAPRNHIAEIDNALRPFEGYFNEPIPTSAPAQRNGQSSIHPSASINVPEIQLNHGQASNRALPSRQATHPRQPTMPAAQTLQPQPSFTRPQSSIIPITKPVLSPRHHTFSVPAAHNAKRQRLSLAPPKSSSSNSPNRFLSPANISMPRIRTSHSVRPAPTITGPADTNNLSTNANMEAEMANRFYAAGANTNHAQTFPTPTSLGRNVMGPPPTPARQSGRAWIRSHEHVPGTGVSVSAGNGGFVSASTLPLEGNGFDAKGGYARTSDGRFARIHEI